MTDDLLEIEDRADPFERMKRAPGQLAMADADQAAAFGAEQRLDDDVAAQLIERLEGRCGRLTGPGRGDRKVRLPRAGPASGTCPPPPRWPRGIEDRDARRRDPVQGIHAEDDLFEAPRRHHPHQDASRRPSNRLRRPGRPSVAGSTQTEAETSGRGAAWQRDVEPLRRPLQVGDVPAESRYQGRPRTSGERLEQDLQVPVQ